LNRSTLGLRVIKKKNKYPLGGSGVEVAVLRLARLSRLRRRPPPVLRLIWFEF